MIKNDFLDGDRRPGAEFYRSVAKAANLASEIRHSVYQENAPDANALSGQVSIQIINDTGQAIPSLSVLEICDPLGRSGSHHDTLNFTLNKGIVYKGRVPTGDHPVVITLAPLRPGEVNDAAIMGIVPCQVDVKDVSHRFAKPMIGNRTRLESSDSGDIRIVLPPSQTGIQTIDVLLGFAGVQENTTNDSQAVPIFYPARQIHPAAENLSENKLLWSDSSDPFHSLGTWYMHACGLTNEVNSLTALPSPLTPIPNP